MAESWDAAQHREVVVEDAQKCRDCGGKTMILLVEMARRMFRAECKGCGSTVYVEKPAR